jgi:patatin-related protein
LKEKELRIALVCFGGVSLAVYMHGINKEILKLVRASSALHAITDRTERASASFFDKADRSNPEFDTDEIYFDLLREIGRSLELRVIVDIVAGASAGGINGTMLARALSHDLPMGALRDLWLEHADVTDLLAPEARARAGSKLVLRPLISMLGALGYWDSIRDPEVRRKVSLFVRSRWFKPPLSGRRMAELMYNAVTAMGENKNPLASLLPSGQRLDLFVTVTDHYGYQQLIRIHDPPVIHEREHRHVLRFRYHRRPNGEIASDFVLDNAPALAFAARATSSFPGAFPPTQIGEMDEVVAGRAGTWPRRADFISRWQRAEQPTIPRGDRRHSRPPGLQRGRPAACLYRARSGARRDAEASRGPRLLYHPEKRVVGIAEYPAGDRRAQLGQRFQRPHAAPA